MLRNRALMVYVLAFAGNIWEVSAVRAWFVAYLAWVLGLPGHALAVPAPAVISGLASLAGFPVSIAVAELALRWGPRAIVGTCIVSMAVLATLAATAGGPSGLVLPLLECRADRDRPEKRCRVAGKGIDREGGAATRGIGRGDRTAGERAGIGHRRDLRRDDRFGGAGSAPGWTAGFAVMALGSTAAIWAICAGRRRPQPAQPGI